MSLSLPYFKLDVIDWLKSEKIEAMHNECVGAYIMLLCEAWTRPFCSLPCEPLALMRLARWTGDHKDFHPVLACFTPLKNDPKRVINVKLRKVWDEAHARVTALSEAGKKGAQVKQEMRANRPVRTPKPKPIRTLSDSSFEQFWNAYPKKIGKLAAQQAWNKSKEKPDVVDILKAVDMARKTEQWTKDNGQFIPHPSTWLNEGRWSDQPLVNGSGKQKPPPPPPKNDPIGRGLWGRTYGRPQDHGYE